MNRSISFSVKDDEYKTILHEANSRGITPSTLAKMKLFDSFNKSPSKGVMAQLDLLRIEYAEKILELRAKYGDLPESLV